MAVPDGTAVPPTVARTKAQVLERPRGLRLQDVPLEAFSALHVQVRLHSIGLSSSDLIYYSTFAHEGASLKAPIIIGKEAVGEIIAVGSLVAKTWPHLRLGSKVAIEPSIPCRICHECTTGKYNVCVNMRSAAHAAREPYVHGFLRKEVNWPGEMTHCLPLNVNYDLGTLAEPLSRVIHSARRVNLQPSTSVAVLGSGLPALLTCAYAKSIGCYPICIIDTDISRMDVAVAQEWATHTYTVPATPANISQVHGNESLLNARKAVAFRMLHDLGFLAGYETVFETTGSETGMQLSLFLARRAGKVALTNGQDKTTQLMPIGEAIVREIDLVSCHGYAGTFPAALSCLASGSLGNVRSLLTQKVPFERAESGFKWLLASRDNQNKPVFRVLVGTDGAQSAQWG